MTTLFVLFADLAREDFIYILVASLNDYTEDDIEPHQLFVTFLVLNP